MKRKIVLSMLSLFFIAIVLAPLSLSAAEIELKCASWGSSKHFISVQLGEWINDVNTALAGKYKIVEYPGGQLYGPKQMHMAVAKGSVDIGVILTPAMLAMVPMLQGSYLPFAFDDLDDAAKVYQGESMAILEKYLAKKQIKFIYTNFTDGIQVFSSKKTINTVDDFKGLRVLTQSPMFTDIILALDAAPDSSIPFNEQYMALKRGISDATLTSIVGGYFDRTAEVAGHITKCNMAFATIPTAMNLKKWNNLSQEARDVMTKLGKATEAKSLATAKAWETKFTADMINLGTDLKIMKDEERAKIKAITQPVWQKWAKENGPDAERLLELNSGN